MIRAVLQRPQRVINVLREDMKMNKGRGLARVVQKVNLEIKKASVLKANVLCVQ